MTTTNTTLPRRHDSLRQKPRSTKNINHQAPMHNKSYYELDKIKSSSQHDFLSTLSPTSTNIIQSQILIDNTNKIIHPLTPSLTVSKSMITKLPTRSSSLTNPVTKMTNTSNHPLPIFTTVQKSISCSTYNNNSHSPITCSPPMNFTDDSEEDVNDNHYSEKVDNDIEKAMLHWKRQSTLTLSKPTFNNHFSSVFDEAQMNYSFFTENTELWSPSSIFGDIEAVLKKPSFQDNCQQTADQLWMEDETLVRRKDMATFLGKSKLFHHTVLQLYLEKFDFTSQNLEQAFRCVCSKLYFKAEAQEIDRILEAFAYRYWYCNKESKILCNADIVYAVVYSMLLLNTDLHIVHGSNHHRMSRSSFCENTMATILNNIDMGAKYQQQSTGDISVWKQDMEVYLKETYASVKLQGILQPGTADKNQSSQRYQQQLKESGVATTTKSLFQRMGSLKHSSSTRRKTSAEPGTSVKKETGPLIEQRKSYSHADQIPELEGRIRYRTNGDTRRRNTKSSPSSYDWHESWLTLHHQGYLRLEKQQLASSRLIRQTNQHSSWELDLGHSWVARDGHILHRHKHNHHRYYQSPGSLLATFHLVLGNGIWYEIECEDQDKVDIWVNRIQLRGAMVTNIPFMKPPISSDMYGWEANLMEQCDRLLSCTISTWEPPQSPTTSPVTIRFSSSSSSSSTSIPSLLYSPGLTTSSEISIIHHQQTGIQQQLITLREDHQLHSTLFSPISKIPTIYHSQKTLILTNWHEKNNYLLQEMEKYEIYDKALQNHMTSLSCTPSPSTSSRTNSDPLSLLALDNHDYSFDLFDEISHSLKHVSLE